MAWTFAILTFIGFHFVVFFPLSVIQIVLWLPNRLATYLSRDVLHFRGTHAFGGFDPLVFFPTVYVVLTIVSVLVWLLVYSVVGLITRVGGKPNEPSPKTSDRRL
jgi:hypothetical protein